MSIKTIEYEVSIAGITPATEQFGGTQGDHRVRGLKFSLTDELYTAAVAAIDNGKLMYRFDVYDGEGGIWSSEPTELTEQNVNMELEERHTRFGGKITVYLVITALSDDSETDIELYSFPAVLRLKNRPDGEYQDGESYESVTTLANAAKTNAEAAAQSAVAVAEALQGYVSKVTDPSDYLKVYTSGFDGNTVMRDLEETDAKEFHVGDIVVRNIHSNLSTETPIDETDCANKAYVDNKIDDSVDQTYNGESENAQSGIAVAEAVSTKEDKNYLTQYLTYEVADNKACITKCNASLSGDIVIPDMLGGYPVTSIGERAFYRCGNLTSITLPDSVTYIGSSAFNRCSNITSITIPDSVTNIGDSALVHCTYLKDVYYGGSEEDKQNITFGINNVNLLNVTWHYNQVVATKEYVDEKAGDVDQTYDATSENAQSGVAVAEALNSCVQKQKGNGHVYQVYAVSDKLDEYDDTTLFVENNEYFENGWDYATIPRRQSNGNLMTNAPVKDLDCANKSYVDAAISNLSGLKVVIVSELAEIGEEDTLYFIPTTDTQDQNLYDEYIYTNGAWEKIGSAAVEVDLTDYVKKQEFTKQTAVNGSNAGYTGNAYIVSYNGEQTQMPICAQNNIFTIVSRDAAGNFYIGEPNQKWHAATKNYVDNKFKEYELVEEITVSEETSVDKNTTPDGELYSSLYKNMMVSIYNANDKACSYAYVYRDGDPCRLSFSVAAGEFGVVKNQVLTEGISECFASKQSASGYGNSPTATYVQTSSNVSRVLVGGCTAGTVIKIYGMKA